MSQRQSMRLSAAGSALTFGTPCAASEDAESAAGLPDSVIALLSVRTLATDPDDESECQVRAVTRSESHARASHRTALTPPSRVQVCLGAFRAGDELLSLPCCHAYHRECIIRWLRSQTTCPVCKNDLSWLSAASHRASPAARGTRPLPGWPSRHDPMHEPG